MSERGSFITEYIYDDTLFDICRDVLSGNDKYFQTTQIGTQPIIAGKIGGLYFGEEIVDFELNIIPQIQERMTEDMNLRLVVLSENGGECLFYITKYDIKTIRS